jgi:hypothetical protein
MTVFRRTIARCTAILLMSLATLVSVGCLQLSLNPLFTPDEAVFDEHLVGAWTCGEETWTFRRASDPDLAAKGYEVEVRSGVTTATLVALIGRLGDRTFITLTPGQLDDPSSSPFTNAHVVTGFTFGRVVQDGDRLQLSMLDSAWIAKAYRAGLLSIGVNRVWPGDGPDGDVLLIARPTDLQRFAQTYADDDAVFGEQIRFRRSGAPAPGPASASAVGEKCYQH